MGKKRKNIPVVLMLILLVPMSAFSQKYGAVKGKVTDADSKERLVYATIVIKGTTRGTTSDIEGKYILTNLAPGEYTLDFSFIGYEKVERTVQVEAGKTVVVNVELRPRSIMGKEVLNDKETYLETSCSAIFVLAMARGITHGWLDTSFLPVVEKGWEGLTSKISADGIVSGICKGTSISEKEEYYMRRKRVDNDPRGLGAVITAGMEMENVAGKMKIKRKTP